MSSVRTSGRSIKDSDTRHVEAFIAEAADHPVFELQPPSKPVNHAG